MSEGKLWFETEYCIFLYEGNPSGRELSISAMPPDSQPRLPGVGLGRNPR